jgi:hypothetical protein
VQGEEQPAGLFADDHPEWRDILIGRAVQVLA